MVNLRHSCPITQSEGAKTFVTRLYSRKKTASHSNIRGSTNRRVQRTDQTKSPLELTLTNSLLVSCLLSARVH